MARGLAGVGDVLINYTVRGTGDPDSDRLVSDVAAAFARVERFAGIPLGYAPLGKDGLIPAEFLGDPMTPSLLHVSIIGGNNAIATVTLPGVSGKFHFITSIRLVRVAIAAVGGGAMLQDTSTNLPGNPIWTTGNAIAVGQQIVDLDYRPTTPLRSLASGVATTITMPAAGANAFNGINVSYYVA